MAKKIKYSTTSPSPSPIVSEAVTFYNEGLSLRSVFKDLASIIGGIGIKTNSQESDLIPLIRKGLNKGNLEQLMATTGLSLKTLSDLLHVSERTLHRYSSDMLLSPEISERILEIAKIYALGSQVLGSLDAFKAWVQFPSWSLGHQTPLSFLDTSIGVRLIEEELGRIEQGVLS
jgi:putative toxin-antitoxin system antitoxin component (TIGR02293 family)